MDVELIGKSARHYCRLNNLDPEAESNEPGQTNLDVAVAAVTDFMHLTMAVELAMAQIENSVKPPDMSKVPKPKPPSKVLIPYKFPKERNANQRRN